MGAPRSVGHATISLGLVSIPVRFYTATSQNSISFNLIHADCGSRIEMKCFCKHHGEEVPREELIKGYEHSEGKYLTFTKDEIKALEEPATHLVEIDEFLPVSAIDPVYFDKAYYVGPDEGGAKAYALLAAALERTSRVAIARWATKGKQYIVMLRAVDGKLVLQQLLYSDEVRPLDSVPVGDSPVRDEEVEAAVQLIEATTGEQFHPENYRDEHRERVLAMIEAKANGEAIEAAKPVPAAKKAAELLDVLKASLEVSKRKPKTEATPTKAKASRSKGVDPRKQIR